MSTTTGYADLAARIRVPLGFVLGAVYFVFAQPTGTTLFWGSLIALAGLALRAAGAGHLSKNQRMAAAGPYAYMRHPLYLGSSLAGIGYCVAGGRWWFFVILAIFLTAIYLPVIRREEANLSKLFPAYATYVRTVPFLPEFRRAVPRQQGSDAGFSWRQYRKNREYEAFVAFLGIVAVLLLKMRFPEGLN